MWASRHAAFALIAASLIAWVCIPATASGIPARDIQTLLNTSHRGSVLAMEYDENGGKLFTCGEDGTIRMWDLASGRLARTLRIGHEAVSMLAVNPMFPQLAVLETDGIRSYSVSVWDWESGDALFRIPLDEEPLFLRYSGMGGYLLLGVSRWEGLRIVHSSDGSPVPFHPEGFGIVSYAEISVSEKTVMTYQPSGRIAYWDFASGELAREVKSVPALSRIRITRDRRYLLAMSGKETLLVDLLSGVVKSRVEIGGIVSEDISSSGSEIACLDGGGSTVSLLRLSGDALLPVDSTIPAPPRLAIVKYAADRLFAADDGGGIFELLPGEQPKLFAKDELSAVSGIAVNKDTIALAGNHWVSVFRYRARGELEVSRPVEVANPFKVPVALEFLGNSRILTWSREGEKSGYAVLDPAAGVFSPMILGFANPLVQVLPQGDTLITLEKGGMVKIVDIASGDSRFSTWMPGMNEIAMVSPKRLIGGRSAAGAGESSLLSMDTQTGETVALSTSSVFTYELMYDPARQILYSIGVEENGDTVLLAHSGKELEKETAITRYAGDDLSASLVVDEESGVLYTSLGYDHIRAWDGEALSELPTVDSTPRTLAIRGGVLCSLNSDSSVSIWDPTSKRLMGTLYALTEGEWCLLFPDGQFAASDGAAVLVNVMENGSFVDDKDQFRVKLP